MNLARQAMVDRASRCGRRATQVDGGHFWNGNGWLEHELIEHK
jgi:hypothetical protein